MELIFQFEAVKRQGFLIFLNKGLRKILYLAKLKEATLYPGAVPFQGGIPWVLGVSHKCFLNRCVLFPSRNKRSLKRGLNLQSKPTIGQSQC